MPELPEVETTRRGIQPYLEGARIEAVVVREPRLRWPVSPELEGLVGQRISAVERRAKYLLLRCGEGTVLVHLGMSGSLRIAQPELPWRKHDHVAMTFSRGQQLRFHDPRRFGAWLWTAADPFDHPLLRDLGPEPLGHAFTAEHLKCAFAGRRRSVKEALMDAKVVVGVGNIYACEALFLAGIHPRRAAGRISLQRLQGLVDAVRLVLEASIRQGGTTLRDFLHEDGSPGYFRQQLRVYARAGEACRICDGAVRREVLGQRSTYFCPRCQR